MLHVFCDLQNFQTQPLLQTLPLISVPKGKNKKQLLWGYLLEKHENPQRNHQGENRHRMAHNSQIIQNVCILGEEEEQESYKNK